MDLPNRKTIRLKNYDYNTPGYYFITICTKGKQKLLCDIVGTVLPDGPEIILTDCGRIVQKQLQMMSGFYDNLIVDKYVIMPNHIHMIVHLLECTDETTEEGRGPSGRTIPTVSKIGRFVGSFKRFCNREYGDNIWQSRSHDHIIRGERDYLLIWNYIDCNPAKWTQDCFYIE